MLGSIIVAIKVRSLQMSKNPQDGMDYWPARLTSVLVLCFRCVALWYWGWAALISAVVPCFECSPPTFGAHTTLTSVVLL
jgi:hypothetical protein